MLCFVTNSAYSQKESNPNTCSWYLKPPVPTPPGIPPPPARQFEYYIPCLTEVVWGDVDEIQYTTNNTYHVKAKGILYGYPSGDEYEISYEYNQYVKWFEVEGGWAGSDRFILPIILKHEGKLVAIIHRYLQAVYNGHGESVNQYHHTIDVICN
jgi:hypothetical protein